MKRKSLKIGSVTLSGNALLAPLAGFTDYAFRALAIENSAALAFTEMVSCKGLVYGSEKTADLLYTTPAEKVKACQVFGSEPDVMRAALESEAIAPFDIVDINMGCPVPKIFGNGEGSALLANPPLAEKIVSACAKTGKTVTVKIRIGIRRGERVAAEFAKRMAGAGARMITVHGRVREDYYAGEPDYAEIARVKRAVDVPVIANGGIFDRASADRMAERTGADGVMIARGALGAPWIFREIYGEPYVADKYNAVRRHIEMLTERYPESRAVVGLRKAVACYLKGERGGKEMKEKVFRAESATEMLAAVAPLSKPPEERFI